MEAGKRVKKLLLEDWKNRSPILYSDRTGKHIGCNNLEDKKYTYFLASKVG